MNADSLRRAVAATRPIVASVRPAQMNDPTPCGSWRVRDLLDHMVDAPTFIAVVMETGDWRNHSGVSVDPERGGHAAGYDGATERAIAAFGAAGAMSRAVTLPVVGDLPGASLLVLATCDALVHGWDLARATGRPIDPDAELATEVLESIRPLMTERMRGPEGTTLFGPEVRVPPDASPPDRLAAFLGRRP
jgi:uncharacterized protein (TIGR03086 family)